MYQARHPKGPSLLSVAPFPLVLHFITTSTFSSEPQFYSIWQCVYSIIRFNFNYLVFFFFFDEIYFLKTGYEIIEGISLIFFPFCTKSILVVFKSWCIDPLQREREREREREAYIKWWSWHEGHHQPLSDLLFLRSYISSSFLGWFSMVHHVWLINRTSLRNKATPTC